MKEEDTQESFEEVPDIQKGYNFGSSSEENDIPVMVQKKIRASKPREEASPSKHEHLDLIEQPAAKKADKASTKKSSSSTGKSEDF